MKIILHIIIFSFLTILTQVGGVIWLIAIPLSKKISVKKRIVFPMLYLFFNFIIIPPIAKQFGRVPLPVFHTNIKPRNIFYPLCFRNYVKPKLKLVLDNVGNTLLKEQIQITYLDANFPFIDGFRLFPHLSHHDGKKVDISFMYKTKKGIPTNKKPSVSGYGVYAEPKSYKGSQTERCLEKGYWLYNKAYYLSLGTMNSLDFDAQKTQRLLTALLKERSVSKILLEPHLKKSLNLHNYQKIRFHGCNAVRHDDHVHLQIN